MRKLLICFVVVAFVFAAVPAMAAEKTLDERVKAIEECLDCLWSFYGSVRMATFWTNENTTAADMYDRDEIQWDLQGNSRIGAKAKVGDIGGRFEYGHDSAGGNTTLRLLFATWNFGPGTILIGQDYSPTFQLFADQVHGGDADLLNYGASLGRSRVPQIKLIWGGFQFALVRPVERAATSA
ncbi:MAG: hypothetical protein JW821_02920, partial [Deltaproteobacteria bacterium]|nr:hypothetical protein [Deltaproteobacteria bacterium]